MYQKHQEKMRIEDERRAEKQAAQATRDAQYKAECDAALERNKLNVANIKRIATAVGELCILDYTCSSGEVKTAVFTVRHTTNHWYKTKTPNVELNISLLERRNGSSSEEPYTTHGSTSASGTTVEDALSTVMRSW